jgi:alkylhydroperoxidase family enzyme
MLDADSQGQRGLGCDRREKLIAGLLTAMTGFCTSSAVLHAVLRVLIALIATQLACCRACLECCTRHRRLEGRLPRQNAAGGKTHIGAVEVEPDAADQHLRILLA